jgi:hypothetical protein
MLKSSAAEMPTGAEAWAASTAFTWTSGKARSTVRGPGRPVAARPTTTVTVSVAPSSCAGKKILTTWVKRVASGWGDAGCVTYQ